MYYTYRYLYILKCYNRRWQGGWWWTGMAISIYLQLSCVFLSGFLLLHLIDQIRNTGYYSSCCCQIIIYSRNLLNNQPYRRSLIPCLTSVTLNNFFVPEMQRNALAMFYTFFFLQMPLHISIVFFSNAITYLYS